MDDFSGFVVHSSFPKDETRKKVWVQKLRRENFTPTKFSKVCSKHFEENCFDREKFGGVWLKADAVPTIFNFPKHLNKQTARRKSPVKRTTNVGKVIGILKYFLCRIVIINEECFSDTFVCCFSNTI